MEPDAHLGDDSEITLKEETLDGRAECELGQMCRGRVGHGELPSPDNVAICEDDFHSTDVLMVSRCRSESGSAVKSLFARSQRPARKIIRRVLTLPTTLPHPSDGTLGQTLSLFFAQCS